jgi:hypothetical protein
MSVAYTFTVEVMISSLWVDITSDLRKDITPTITRGIPGSMVTDRVADVGTFDFALDNSVGNLGGVLGYYSPDNTNCMSGWALGTKVRVKILYSGTYYYKLFGKISKITPITGMYKERYVAVQAVDYMNEMLVHNMLLVPVQTGKRGNELLTTVVANLPTPPQATSYATGPDIFAYALHDIQDESTSAMSAMQSVDQSGLSYTFVTGNSGPTYGAEISTDGGMETWTDATHLTNWTLTGAGATLAQETVTKYAGTYSAKITTAGALCTIYGSIPVLTAGVRYRLQGWISTGTQAASIKVQTTGTPNYTHTTTANTTEYFSNDEFVAVGTENRIVCVALATANTCYFDAISLMQITSEGGETLVWQSRHTRALAGAAVATFSDTMSDMSVSQSLDGRVYTTVHGQGFPAQLGTTNEVLWTARKDIVIGAGESQTLDAQYVDPSGAGTRIALIPASGVTPVVTTDYTMGSAAGGTDLNANLTVTVNTWGGNTANVTLTNSAAVTGHVWVQLRGKIIRQYEPIIVTKTFPLQINYGDRVLTYSMPYQDSLNTVDAFTQELMYMTANPMSHIDSMEFIASKDSTLMGYAMVMDIGSRITISETVSGFGTVRSFDLFLNKYSLIFEPGVLRCKLENFVTYLDSGVIGVWGTSASDSTYWGPAGTGTIGNWVF